METTHLAMHFNPLLVALSWAVAIFAAYSALSTINRMRENRGKAIWLVSGAIAFGTGVWAMHFIGMAALDIGLPISYKTSITALSVLGSIVGALIAFGLVGQAKVGFGRLLLGGVALGAGIGVMHYVGMLAIQSEAPLSFDRVTFLASVGVAVAISTLGLWLITADFMKRIPGHNFLIAAVVGAAIPVMHYVGMFAARFSPPEVNAMTMSIQHQIGFYDTIMVINVAVVFAIMLMALPLFAASFVQTQDNLGTEVEP